MNLKKKIRVLVVDDSLFFRNILIKGLSSDPGIEEVDSATDTFSARDKIIKFKPDVITMDIEMPGMNGIDFLREYLPRNPIPTVVVSSVGKKVFEATNAGAVDFVTKTDMSSEVFINSFLNELLIKIKIASTAKVVSYQAKPAQPQIMPETRITSGERIIAIGASTGGTEAIFRIIKEYPVNMPGTVIVQHMPPGFTRLYAERLDKSCSVEVKEAESGDKLYQGRVLIAPGDFHMLVNKTGNGYSVDCVRTAKVNGHCPSVEVLFDSVARNAGANAIGVILTGMGGDGARGLLRMRENNGRTIGQDEKSCVVYGMPKVAFEIGAVEKQAPIENILNIIKSFL